MNRELIIHENVVYFSAFQGSSIFLHGEKRQSVGERDVVALNKIYRR